MLFAIALLIVIISISYKIAPRERQEDVHVHGAGQVGMLAALALFGVDFFTSYFYATGELMSALHPYGLQRYGYIAVAVISFANLVFGALYMFSLGVFNEGGGSFTAAMRYLGPSLSLVVAVVLIQDYVLTIVVSTLSGSDQLLSIIGGYSVHWFWHFLIGASMAMVIWYLTIRGRGESAQIVFTLLSIFFGLTLIMLVGLILASNHGVPPVPSEPPLPASLGQALYHLLTASMKGMVALSGLEAMSNGIQFVIDEDFPLIKWGKKRVPRLNKLWNFYSGKAGIGRAVQTVFLFYGGLTTFFLTAYSLRFNVFDGTLGRTLVGNLAFIGFTQLPGGTILYWFYQFLAVALLSTASMTAFQDLQSIAWRNVAIGEIPEFVVYRNPKGTFTRPVTAAVIAAIVIQLLVRGKTTLAVPYYGVGVFLPITAMGLAMRKHIQLKFSGRAKLWGTIGTDISIALSTFVFVGQIVGKWEEGGWIVLISLSVLILMAHAILISPIGYRNPDQVYRIVRVKSHIQGPMGNIVEWQSLKVQEYRYQLLVAITRFWELFGVRRPMRFEPPPPSAGDYEEAVNSSGTSDTFLSPYLNKEQPSEKKEELSDTESPKTPPEKPTADNP